jgi:hypothetical protein
MRFEGLGWKSYAVHLKIRVAHRFADFAGILLHLAAHSCGALAASICFLSLRSGAHCLVFATRGE